MDISQHLDKKKLKLKSKSVSKNPNIGSQDGVSLPNKFTQCYNQSISHKKNLLEKITLCINEYEANKIKYTNQLSINGVIC